MYLTLWKSKRALILDLGCGDGGLTEELAQLVPNGTVLEIDASKGMIETAKDNGELLWDFAGEGNCSNFFKVIRDKM